MDDEAKRDYETPRDYDVPPHERKHVRYPAALNVSQSAPKLSFGNIDEAAGLTVEDAARVQALLEVFDNVHDRNARIMKYYNQDVTLPDVNMGFALDERLARTLDVRCGWPAKAVSCLVTRSVFDGFVSTDEYVAEDLRQIVRDNQLVQAYNRARFSEATLGVTFATLSWDEHYRARIRFHTAQTAAGVWDGTRARIAYGMAVIDSARYNGEFMYRPSIVNLYTDEATVVLTRVDSENWEARYVANQLGRPMMEPLIHNPTDQKPFGSSRVTKTVMATTDEAIRTLGRMAMASELFTYPQKYLLGLTDELVANLDSFALAMNRIIKLGANPETGANPDVRQMQASSMEPHITVLRSLATTFAGETACPVSELGIIQDNPSSAEAILASKEALITLVESFNAANSVSLYNIGRMALALNHNVSLDSLYDSFNEFEPHFKSPTLASMVAQADVVTKIAAVDPEFAGTDTFYALMGIDGATIQQIQSEKAANRGKKLLEQLLAEPDTTRDEEEDTDEEVAEDE